MGRFLFTLAVGVLIGTAALAADRFDVTAYGTVGDGVTRDTAAIQKALDACHAAGGGEAFFPAGRYLTGTLKLSSNTTLVVSPDAVILGSTDLNDYHSRKFIIAEDAENIAITGGGTIDGQGQAFWEWKGPYTGTPWRGTAQFEYRALKRPSFILFRRCTNVTLRDITLKNSASWTVHVQRCRNVVAERVTIRNPLHGPNTDGFDVNSCIDVKIGHCDIITGDDGVVLKSTEPGHDHPSRNITVTNCRIWSACNNLKIGTETHDVFENIVFRDCYLYSGENAKPLERTLSGLAIESVDGSHLSNITAENLTMVNVRTPIFVRLGHRGGNSKRNRQVEPRVPGTIRNVTIRNVAATKCLFESSITGIPGHPVEDITLSDISLSYEGGGVAGMVSGNVVDEAVIKRYPEAQMFGRLPAWGMFCRHVKGITMRNISMACTTQDARPMLVCDDVQGLVLDAVNARSVGSFPVIWFQNVTNATLRDCVAPPGTGVFLAAEGNAETLDTIALNGNDLSNAKTPTQLLPPGGMIAQYLPVVRQTGSEAITIEGEALWLALPMVVRDDATTSSGKCIEVPSPRNRDLGAAGCRFELQEAGNYTVRLRVFAPDRNSNSVYVSIDSGEEILVDIRDLNEWRWQEVGATSDGKEHAFALKPGMHTLFIRGRESGTRIDSVVIANATADPPPPSGK